MRLPWTSLRFQSDSCSFLARKKPNMVISSVLLLLLGTDTFVSPPLVPVIFCRADVCPDVTVVVTVTQSVTASSLPLPVSTFPSTELLSKFTESRQPHDLDPFLSDLGDPFHGPEQYITYCTNSAITAPWAIPKHILA